MRGLSDTLRSLAAFGIVFCTNAGICGESQAGGTADASDGHRGGVREAETEPAWGKAQDLSLLLKGLKIERRDQVWCTDITYIPMPRGFLYLVAVMDWFSRFVLSWALSLTLELEFCLETLRGALRRSRPEIFNSDQGSQFTSEWFLGELEPCNIAISMDGRGRCLDNIFIERLWRSQKYEEVYLKDYQLVSEARTGIEKYFQFYNYERLHQSLDYQTPAAIYEG